MESEQRQHISKRPGKRAWGNPAPTKSKYGGARHRGETERFIHRKRPGEALRAPVRLGRIAVDDDLDARRRTGGLHGATAIAACVEADGLAKRESGAP